MTPILATAALHSTEQHLATFLRAHPPVICAALRCYFSSTALHPLPACHTAHDVTSLLPLRTSSTFPSTASIHPARSIPPSSPPSPSPSWSLPTRATLPQPAQPLHPLLTAQEAQHCEGSSDRPLHTAAVNVFQAAPHNPQLHPQPRDSYLTTPGRHKSPLGPTITLDAAQRPSATSATPGALWHAVPSTCRTSRNNNYTAHRPSALLATATACGWRRRGSDSVALSSSLTISAAAIGVSTPRAWVLSTGGEGSADCSSSGGGTCHNSTPIHIHSGGGRGSFFATWRTSWAACSGSCRRLHSTTPSTSTTSTTTCDIQTRGTSAPQVRSNDSNGPLKRAQWDTDPGSGGGGGGGPLDGPADPVTLRAARRAAARSGKGAMPQRGRFVDWAVLRARGGAGGAGCAAFEATARGRKLTATGGSGGPGGAVVIRADSHVSSLYGIGGVIVGGAGCRGGSNGQTGGRGEDRVIEVPLGTTVRVWRAAAAAGPEVEAGAETDMELWGDDEDVEEVGEEEEEEEEEEEGEECAGRGSEDGEGGERGETEVFDPRFGSPPCHEVDLVREGQRVLVARGGLGGRGNAAQLAVAGRPVPDSAEKGTAGDDVWVKLETRLLADIGFVGLPNAGKSTLLAAITAARTKIGSYAFTTVRPQLGTLTFPDGVRLVTADIPGLVQGAHANRGRGNAFLRHIERCRCLAYVVDLSGGVQRVAGPEGGTRPGAGLEEVQEGSGGALTAPGALPLSPEEQVRVLQDELRRYRPQLLSAPSLVVANKLDACVDPRTALAALVAATALPIVPVAAAHGLGLARLKDALRAVVQQSGRTEGATAEVQQLRCAS